MASRDRTGFTLFELTVVLCIASLVLIALAHRITRLQADAEIAQMEYVVRVLRRALVFEVASAVAADRRTELADLIGSNPVTHLGKPPVNYIGEIRDPDPKQIDGGYWYFDRDQRLLVYRVRNTSHFYTDLGGAARARFKFTAVHSDPSSYVEGLQLAPAEPYRWVHAPATEE